MKSRVLSLMLALLMVLSLLPTVALAEEIADDIRLSESIEEDTKESMDTISSPVLDAGPVATNSDGVLLKNASGNSMGITLYTGMDGGFPWYDESWGASTTLTGPENNKTNPAFSMSTDIKSMLLVFDGEPFDTSTSTSLSADNEHGGVRDVPTITYLGTTNEDPARYAYKVEFSAITGTGNKPFAIQYKGGAKIQFELWYVGKQGDGGQTETVSENYKLNFGDDFTVMLNIPDYMKSNLVITATSSSIAAGVTTARVELTAYNNNSDGWIRAADNDNNRGNLMYAVYISAPNGSTKSVLTNAGSAADAYSQLINGVEAGTGKLNQSTQGAAWNNFTVSCGGTKYQVGSPDAFAVATAVTKATKQVIYPESSTHGICTIFTDDNYSVMSICNLDIVVKVANGFSKQEAPLPNYVSADRISYDPGTEDYSPVYNELSGTLSYTVGIDDAELNGEYFAPTGQGNFRWNFATVKHPDGYPYLLSCGALNSNLQVAKRDETRTATYTTLWTDSKDTGVQAAVISRVGDYTYYIRWRNDQNEEYLEYITLSLSDISREPALATDSRMPLESSRTDIDQVISELDPDTMNLEFNEESGLYRLTFSEKMPTVEDLLRCIRIYAPEGAVSYKAHSTWSTTLYNEDVANRMISDINNGELCTVSDLPGDEGGKYIAYPLVDLSDAYVNGVHVYYVATCQPRSFAVDWYDAAGQIIHKEYFCGFNNSAGWETVEGSHTSGEEDAPYIVAAEGQYHLRCTYTPQVASDTDSCYYYQLDLDEMEIGNTTYTICLPYSFISETADYEYCSANLEAPVIRHYNEDHTDYETITGRFTEDGILFGVSSFSPFTLSWEEKTDEPTHHHGGGNHGSGSSGYLITSDLSSITKVTVDGVVVDSKYYTVSGGNVTLTQAYLDTLTSGQHTVKLYSGNKVATATITVTNSGAVKTAKTGDMGIALYVGMSVASVMGTGIVIGKRKKF